MTITDTYSEIAKIEESIKRDATWLEQQEQQLKTWLQNCPDWNSPLALQKAGMLAGIHELMDAWPERLSKLRGQKYQLEQTLKK